VIEPWIVAQVGAETKPWVIVLSIVATAVATVYVGVYTARSARRGQRDSTQMAGWHDLVEANTAEIARLRAERAEDRARLDACEHWRRGVQDWAHRRGIELDETDRA